MEPNANQEEGGALRDGAGPRHTRSARDSAVEVGVEGCVKDVAGDGLDVRIGPGQERVSARHRMVGVQWEGLGMAGWECVA
jgi:hypothetical protein